MIDLTSLDYPTLPLPLWNDVQKLFARGVYEGKHHKERKKNLDFRII